MDGARVTVRVRVMRVGWIVRMERSAPSVPMAFSLVMMDRAKASKWLELLRYGMLTIIQSANLAVQPAPPQPEPALPARLGSLFPPRTRRNVTLPRPLRTLVRSVQMARSRTVPHARLAITFVRLALGQPRMIALFVAQAGISSTELVSLSMRLEFVRQG